MKIWITGICSLIGSHLANELIDQGHEVWGNDLFICGDKDNLPPRAKYPLGKDGPIPIDCADFDTMKHCFDIAKPDVVVHTAAVAAEGFSVFSPHFITSNIAEASVATFSAAIASGVKRIVHMSSMSRYGDGIPPFTEEMPTSPIDPYALAKVYSENVLKTLCDVHGVNWSVMVPHNCVGKGQEISSYRNVITIFLNRLKLGLPVYIYGDGEQKRCFSPIADVIPSIVRAVHGDADGEIVNIGPDHGEISINDVLTICEEVTGTKAERIYLPPRPLTDTVKEAYCSSDKARRLLGYEEKQNLIDCIREMSETMKPRPFNYPFPVEIMTDKIPITWKEKL